MQGKTEKEKLQSFFANVDEDKRHFAFDTIDEYLFFREKVAELRKLPPIQVSKQNPCKQRLTTAGKLIKEYSQVVDAKRGTLLRILNGIENSAADELRAMLKEFE